MAAKTKFFRVMQEGATSDGRNIDRAWIEQMAKNYDPARYASRIWLEHLRSLLPDSPFRAYGDVLALKTEEVDGKLTLLAQLDPTNDLVAMNKARQKLYTSAEVDPNFARSGQAYLVGLAVTDSPASLGTEMLQFAAGAPTNPLSARKQSPDNVFTAAQALTLEFEDDDMTTANQNEEKTMLAKVKALLTTKPEGETKPPAPAADGDTSAAIEALATNQAEAIKEFATIKAGLAAIDAKLKTFADQGQAHTELKAAHDKLAADFAALTAKLDKEPAGGNPRPAATGGNGDVATDC
jgi:capsid scaffolding serine peptidase GPO